jgi:hypothetical protein
MTRMRSSGFHGYIDTKAQPYNSLPSRIITQNRKLLYTFSAHFHPYVPELVRRLLEKSMVGLQSADTEYETPVKLCDEASVKFEDGSSHRLPAQEVLLLADGTRIQLPDGTSARFAGFKIIAESENPSNDDITVSLPADATVTLPRATAARRLDETPIRLVGDASVTLPDGKPRPALYREMFQSLYAPAPSALPDSSNGVFVERPYPVDTLDFTAGGAYAAYNWEIFYHAPFTIAIHLSKNQRFEEAQQWFHYIFDPTDDSEQGTPERFWKVKPFQYTDVKLIEDILVNLSKGEDETLRNSTVDSIQTWKDAPFQPHVVARYRHSAYMLKAIMAYLDNLLAWGDALFRQDTGETLNEATQLYVLAANILGPRPQANPKKGSIRPQTYASLRQNLDEFSNALMELETEIPFDICPHPHDACEGDGLKTMRGLGRSLYFCVPPNDKLLGYWDAVADRLFKIRNSLNIQGMFRQIPLFEPPIDPALLARGAAAGLDIGEIVSGMNQPLPLVRFAFLIQKAAEICQEVKSLGNNLLSAMEKEDGEAMALLRAKHERSVMEMVEHMKYGQLQEAMKAREGLLQTLALTVQRYMFYEKQLGRKAEDIEKAIPELTELDRDSLQKMKFAMQEPTVGLREIDVDIATDIAAQAAQALNGGKLLSSHEVREALLLEGGQLASDMSNIMNIISSVGHFLPNFSGHVQPMGVGITTHYGGSNVGSAVGAIAASSRAIAERLNFEARRASRIDGFARRERDWAFQSNLAAGELNQMFKQLRAAQIREAVAEQELKSHRQQMRNAEEIERFMNEEGTEKTGKKTNKALYTWMKREVKGLYGQCFQFAFEMAKKAERALQHELGAAPGLTFIENRYLAGKEGLLAGEKLYFDIKRMEMAYHELNQREYELTKHVSLLQVDPPALIKLRTTGRCDLRLPEAFFDMDGPGHYFRRVKTVAVTIPCVTGPYVSVNCTLRLTKSSIRKSASMDKGYPRVEDDSRFDDYYSSVQAIVTSTGQGDSGMFETNLRDERYLPFEGSGVISEWQLQLPADPSKGEPCQFDYATISDVILHIRYTAREGGSLLRKEAIAHTSKLITEAQAVGSVRLFSVRHDFPTEWAKFQHQSKEGNPPFELSLHLRDEHYPFWSQKRLEQIHQVKILARASTEKINIKVSGESIPMAKDAAFGHLQIGELTKHDLIKPVGEFKLSFEERAVEDLWIALTWGKNQ